LSGRNWRDAGAYAELTVVRLEILGTVKARGSATKFPLSVQL
jgi:hypothetical protein